MARKLQGLRRGVRSKVFREVEAVLKADPTLKSVIPLGNWNTWDGKATDKQNPSRQDSPTISLDIDASQVRFWTPSSFVSDLFINIKIGIDSLDLEDASDLWEAVEDAFYPRSADSEGNVPQTRRLAIQRRLKSAGAHTGLVMFTVPAVDRDPDKGEDGRSESIGQLKIEVRKESA